ncbi:MAG: hypothetical protein IKM15_01750 [Peptococcaceae bacterium]|nr:hypothetical protein [Peptococcaceae bacterium]
MDFLILLMIVSALMNSVNKSNEAKKKHAEKQSRQTPMMQPQQKKGSTLLEWLDGLEESVTKTMKEMEQPFNEKQVKPKKKVTSAPKKQVVEKKKAAVLPQTTLFDQRDGKLKREREQDRDMQPVKPSVQPLKTIYENTDNCEHRIELNPNIQYQAQQRQSRLDRKQIQVQCQKPEDIVQGVIWAEILGKPKALQNMQRR